MTLTERIIERLAGNYISRRITEATADSDRYYRSLSMTGTLDIPYFDHRQNQIDSLDAYRTNPLASRIVQLANDYVLGKGISVTVQPKPIHDFVQDFWTHRLNHMDSRLQQMMLDLAIDGELFLTFHTNQFDNMSYIRTVPATLINEIDTAPNDIEQATRYHQISHTTNAKDSITQLTTDRWWTAEDMHHYTINRPSGVTRGEGDLVPVLPWLRRYKDWLTDRVIINKYKGSYLWDVTLQGATQATINKKRADLAAAPTPGSIMVHNEAETWIAIQPQINAGDAESDGHALRLMIAAGVGVPLHFLAEGESATRATAKEMGEPTRRHFENRQLTAQLIVTDIIKTVIKRRFPTRVHPYSITVAMPDITNSDNQLLAVAIRDAMGALGDAIDRGLLKPETARSWLYKFAEEKEPATISELADLPDTPRPAPAPSTPSTPSTPAATEKPQ